MKKIGMIVAMDKELKDYFEKLGSVKSLEDSVYDVWQANAYGKELYIIKSGVGEISAAGATQYLITKYGVEVIINFGICGKISDSLKLLDTVVLSSVVYYQFDCSDIDDVLPGVYMGNSYYIDTDKDLVNKLLSLDQSLKTAICASGDKFIGNKEDKDYLSNTFKADVCEMESAGILITCLRNGIKCLLIKSVSDDCDGMDFRTYCALAAQKYVEIVDKFVREY